MNQFSHANFDIGISENNLDKIISENDFIICMTSSPECDCNFNFSKLKLEINFNFNPNKNYLNLKQFNNFRDSTIQYENNYIDYSYYFYMTARCLNKLGDIIIHKPCKNFNITNRIVINQLIKHNYIPICYHDKLIEIKKIDNIKFQLIFISSIPD